VPNWKSFEIAYLDLCVMITRFDVSATLAMDPRNLEMLRAQARQRPEQALQSAARQFEALFLNSLLRSMREATPKYGMFHSEQSRLYTSLLDQQLSQRLSSAKGIGLAEVMVKQLARYAKPLDGAPSAPASGGPVVPSDRPRPGKAVSAPESEAESPEEVSFDAKYGSIAAPADENDIGWNSMPQPVFKNFPSQPSGPADPKQDFVVRVWDDARAAARATGVPAQFLVAQAALESGWGRHEIRRDDGSPSYNVFGIKAGSSWQGPVVTRTTTEYVDGVPRRVTAKFRVYGSYAEAFRDYASLLADNPRYAAVLGRRDAAEFARGLQRAGYATDPLYADKLIRIINSGSLRTDVAVL
jgi:flagellar protein FlgJ